MSRSSSSSGESHPGQLASAETLHGYDRWAASYDHVENPAIAMASWLLDRVPLRCSNEDVIELGCGTGRNIPRVLGEGARSYAGVDGSRGMLEIARTRITDARTRLLEADLLEPWSPPRQYDLALMVLVLEHLPTLDVLPATLAASVRRGGRIRIVDLHHDRIAAGSIAQFREGETEVRFTSIAHAPGAIRAALDSAGFDIELVEQVATDDLVAAVPRIEKQRGRCVMIDITGVRR